MLSQAWRHPGRARLEERLARADIEIGGDRPWDLRVLDARFYDRVLALGTLGLGESYMDGWWDCEALDQFAERALRHGLKKEPPTSLSYHLANARLRLWNLQSVSRSRKVAELHYDLGDELYPHMLGPTMTYSCGYWARASTLEEAQDHKHDLICDKLGLAEHHRLLDIGCGWGQLLAHAHRKTGCRGRGITISRPQWHRATRALVGLPIEVSLLDYRDPTLDADGPFDRIASVGMFEHVGVRNHATFFARAASLLADDGLLLLHTIGNHESTGADPWIDRYIFPNSAVPSVRDIADGIGEHFVLEDWHSFGHDYDRTLLCWADNFERYAAAAEFPFSRRFYRMWRYYLLTFAGGFRAGNYLQLWQLVLSKRGTRSGYRSIR